MEKIFNEGFNTHDEVIFEGDIKVNEDATIGKGSVIGEGTRIMSCKLGTVHIGINCIIGSFTIVENDVKIGDETKVWHFCHIRNNAEIGKRCILGDFVYIDEGVKIGDETKIQNYVPVYHGVQAESGVFFGPNSLTTNDLFPRARTEGEELKGANDWAVTPIYIGKDASIGAGAVLKPGIKIGTKAMIGAGAVITKDVPAGAIIVGNPGRIIRYIDGYEPK